MGAETTVFVEMYHHLAKNFDKQSDEVKKERKKIAKFLYNMPNTNANMYTSVFDFNDDDLDCYEQLGVLGIAKKCKVCDEYFTDYSADRHGEGNCD